MLSAKAQNRIFDVLLGALLSFSLVYTLESSLNLMFSKAGMFLYTIIFLSLFTVLFYNRLSTVISLSVLGGGIIAAAVYITSIHRWQEISNFAEQYFYWLSDYMEYNYQPNLLFSLITVLFLSLVITLFVYFFSVRHFVFLVLLVGGAAVFCIQCMNEMINEIAPFYLFAFTIVLYYLRFVLLKKQSAAGNTYMQHSSLLLCMIPVSAAIIMFAGVMDASSKPLEWKWLDTKVAKVYDYFDQKFDYITFDSFSVATGGFSEENGNLGGRVRLNNTPVLKVKAPYRTYLRGSVKDVYTGNSWTETNKDVFFDAQYGFSFFSPFREQISQIVFSTLGYVGNKESLPEFCSYDDMTVTFERLRTRTIFAPLGTDLLYEDLKSKKIMKNINATYNDTFFFKQRKEKDFTYSMSYFNYYYSNEKLIKILKKCTKGALKKSSVSLSYNDNADSTLSFTWSYDKHTDDYISGIRSKYLQLPDELPQRVRDMSMMITDKYDNDYDKAKALENYLSTTFPYTLDTKSLPHNRDFVDYFLFDQKKGYCTYFASAMAVMARSAGIPSRYVEGYMLPPTPDKEGYYHVTNMNAHAWVEIYLEGFGWVPFEPTAPFVASFYENRKPGTSTEGSFAGFTPYDQYQRMMDRFREDSELDPVVDYSELDVNKKLDKKILIIRISAISVLLLVLAFGVINIVNLIRHRLKLSRIYGMSPKESIISAYDYYMQVLKLQKLGIAPGETPLTYSRRIDAYFSFYKTSFITVSRIFTKARFSNLEITENDKILVGEFHQELLKETRFNTGKFKYFILKNILGRI